MAAPGNKRGCSRVHAACCIYPRSIRVRGVLATSPCSYRKGARCRLFVTPFCHSVGYGDAEVEDTRGSGCVRGALRVGNGRSETQPQLSQRNRAPAEHAALVALYSKRLCSERPVQKMLKQLSGGLGVDKAPLWQRRGW